jgi:hypothetical protein
MAEKIRIGLPESAFPFMPPASKFMEYLGMPGGLAGVVNTLSRRSEKPLLIDPKTVRKAVRDGVSPRSFTPIKDILDSVSTPEIFEYINSSYLSPWMNTKLRQNGLSWLSIVRGTHLRVFQTPRPDTFTEQFIKQRAEQEMENLQTGLEMKKNNPSSGDFDQRWREYLVGFFKQHTEIEPYFIDQGFQIWASLQSGSTQPNKEQAGFLYGLYTRIRVDFYYQLLCNLSLDLIQWFKKCGGAAGHEQWLIESSLFGDMLPVLNGQKRTLPFEQLLGTWRQTAAPGGEILPWAKMAQNLPNPQGIDIEKQSLAQGQTREDRKAAISKNKQSRLREWRHGTRPKPDQLEHFLQNLTTDENAVSSGMMRADIACIWGAFILDELAFFEKNDLSSGLQATLPAFALYPSYWAKYKTQATQIVTA